MSKTKSTTATKRRESDRDAGEAEHLPERGEHPVLRAVSHVGVGIRVDVGMDVGVRVRVDVGSGRSSDRLGLVAFATYPYSVSPLTLDHAWLQQRVDLLEAGEGLLLERVALFDDIAVEGDAFKVVSADYVSTESGTGIVHTAPAYGVDDLALGQQHGLPVIHAVGRDGLFLPEVEPVAGMFVQLSVTLPPAARSSRRPASSPVECAWRPPTPAAGHGRSRRLAAIIACPAA